VLTERLLDPVMSGECDDEQDDGSQAEDIGSVPLVAVMRESLIIKGYTDILKPRQTQVIKDGTLGFKCNKEDYLSLFAACGGYALNLLIPHTQQKFVPQLGCSQIMCMHHPFE
jgi:hypothetical protein